MVLITRILTFQVLSPGRRANSGSSLETSRSSTESPHLRRIYRVMHNIVDVTRCTKRETESKLQKQYINILKQRACLLVKSLSILKKHTCCALKHYYTIFQDNINSWQYYKNNRSFDQTKHYRVKVTVKSQA